MYTHCARIGTKITWASCGVPRLLIAKLALSKKHQANPDATTVSSRLLLLLLLLLTIGKSIFSLPSRGLVISVRTNLTGYCRRRRLHVLQFPSISRKRLAFGSCLSLGRQLSQVRVASSLRKIGGEATLVKESYQGIFD